jgi:hypothetical protein
MSGFIVVAYVLCGAAKHPSKVEIVTTPQTRAEDTYLLMQGYYNASTGVSCRAVKVSEGKWVHNRD